MFCRTDKQTDENWSKLLKEHETMLRQKTERFVFVMVIVFECALRAACLVLKSLLETIPGQFASLLDASMEEANFALCIVIGRILDRCSVIGRILDWSPLIGWIPQG